MLDVEGRHCLHYAAESSSQTAHECVQLLLRKHKNLLEVKVRRGRGLLLLFKVIPNRYLVSPLTTPLNSLCE